MERIPSEPCTGKLLLGLHLHRITRRKAGGNRRSEEGIWIQHAVIEWYYALDTVVRHLWIHHGGRFKNRSWIHAGAFLFFLNVQFYGVDQKELSKRLRLLERRELLGPLYNP